MKSFRKKPADSGANALEFAALMVFVIGVVILAAYSTGKETRQNLNQVALTVGGGSDTTIPGGGQCEPPECSFPTPDPTSPPPTQPPPTPTKIPGGG